MVYHMKRFDGRTHYHYVSEQGRKFRCLTKKKTSSYRRTAKLAGTESDRLPVCPQIESSELAAASAHRALEVQDVRIDGTPDGLRTLLFTVKNVGSGFIPGYIVGSSVVNA